MVPTVLPGRGTGYERSEGRTNHMTESKPLLCVGAMSLTQHTLGACAKNELLNYLQEGHRPPLFFTYFRNEPDLWAEEYAMWTEMVD